MKRVKASKGLTNTAARTKVLKKDGAYQVSFRTADRVAQLKFKPKKSGTYRFQINGYTTSLKRDVHLSFEVLDKDNYVPEHFGASFPNLGSLQIIAPENIRPKYGNISINYILRKGNAYYLQFGAVFESKKDEKEAGKRKEKGVFDLYISLKE